MMEFSTKWERQDLIEHLDEFKALYESRPIKDNNGGMKSAHMFPAWYVAKKLQPAYLIESGVWKGLGTWFFEKASPNTKIISIDPNPRFREYTSSKVDYRTQDFLMTDWSQIPKDDCLLFLDDHQNFFERLKYAVSAGFKNLMVEDNYPYQQGDCYTPKKILANTRYVIDQGGNKSWYPKNDADLEFFNSHVSVYQEMPPIFKGKNTRWGDEWNESYPTPEPLLNESKVEEYPLFYDEKKDYTWICYIELN